MGQSRVSGHFITFEGGEGAGKSTQIKLLAKALRTLGYDVVETREPGGSAGAEALRHVILSGAAENFGPAMEAILFAAARNDHVNEVIRPAVERGAAVGERGHEGLHPRQRAGGVHLGGGGVGARGLLGEGLPPRGPRGLHVRPRWRAPAHPEHRPSQASQPMAAATTSSSAQPT